MCGNESTVRVETTGNGFVIDAYSPGKDGPGEHKKHVATSPKDALRLISSALTRVGKKRGKSSAKLKHPKAKSEPAAMKRG